LTIATHDPFLIPEESKYLKKFHAHLALLNITEDHKKYNAQYAKELASVLYADDALRDLIQTYKKRPNFSNTVFVIT
jgi:phosphoglycerol transferase MdoB-like AlkP superfamily enzyme